MNFLDFLNEATNKEQQLNKKKITSKDRKFKVRFHLGAGENFMKWRVENVQTKEVKFYDPKKVCLAIENAHLSNSKVSSTKIHTLKTSKTVVSWIMSTSVTVVSNGKITPSVYGTRVAYNPHVLPHWTKKAETEDELKNAIKVPNKNTKGEDVSNGGELVVDVDKTDYPQLVTKDRSIFILKSGGEDLIKNDIDNVEDKEHHN